MLFTTVCRWRLRRFHLISVWVGGGVPTHVIHSYIYRETREKTRRFYQAASPYKQVAIQYVFVQNLSHTFRLITIQGSWVMYCNRPTFSQCDVLCFSLFTLISMSTCCWMLLYKVCLTMFFLYNKSFIWQGSFAVTNPQRMMQLCRCRFNTHVQYMLFSISSRQQLFSINKLPLYTIPAQH